VKQKRTDKKIGLNLKSLPLENINVLNIQSILNDKLFVLFNNRDSKNSFETSKDVGHSMQNSYPWYPRRLA
jgi:hypothetical protein